MLDINKIKGIIFDYGGTIDSNGEHWAWVIWRAYEVYNVPITKEQFKEAYVHGERFLATNRVVMPEDNFHVLMQKKIKVQIDYLVNKDILTKDQKTEDYCAGISKQCYNFAKNIISKELPLHTALKQKYPMVLVSNFYGNVQSVLGDFGLLDFFDHIIESAVVGVRKPDPQIFTLGVEALGLPSENIVVIGDSHDKDIIPAQKNGCKTIWLKGQGWKEDDASAAADVIITDFMQLKDIFDL